MVDKRHLKVNAYVCALTHSRSTRSARATVL